LLDRDLDEEVAHVLRLYVYRVHRDAVRPHLVADARRGAEEHRGGHIFERLRYVLHRFDLVAVLRVARGHSVVEEV